MDTIILRQKAVAHKHAITDELFQINNNSNSSNHDCFYFPVSVFIEVNNYDNLHIQYRFTCSNNHK